MKCTQCDRTYPERFTEGMIVLTVVAAVGTDGTAILCSRSCLLDYVANLAAMTTKEAPWTGD